jgi:hypothetical protein
MKIQALLMAILLVAMTSLGAMGCKTRETKTETITTHVNPVSGSGYRFGSCVYRVMASRKTSRRGGAVPDCPAPGLARKILRFLRHGGSVIRRPSPAEPGQKPKDA